jgi:hypothetical protein
MQDAACGSKLNDSQVESTGEACNCSLPRLWTRNFSVNTVSRPSTEHRVTIKKINTDISNIKGQ